MNALFLPILIALAWVMLLAAPGHSATLRASTTLQLAQVRIADLFDDTGSSGDRVLGPAPAPGGRIVVEAAQAAAIARQFGIAWRPASGGERVVLDRPGQPVARESVMGVLRDALLAAGLSTEADIDLTGFSAPMVTPQSRPLLAIEQLDLDQSSGRFTATLSVGSDGDQLQRMRLSGRAQEMVDLFVPTRRLPAGTIIRAGDMQQMRIRANLPHGEVVHDIAQALGQATRRIAAQGQPLPLADLGPPVMIARGERVMMQLQSPGLSMTASGTATESGSLGEMIAVQNPASGSLVDAEIIAPGQVRVSPGISATPRRTVVSSR